MTAGQGSELRRSLPYVLPFAVFVGFLAIQHYAPLPGHVDLVLRTVALTAVLALASRSVLSFRTVRPLPSVLLGIAVFLVWIGPDVAFPHYRECWIFQNRILGTLGSSISEDLRHDVLALTLRSFRAVVLVAIVEELFWRGWLMRWLINPHFETVPLGAWNARSFWITALLFASEHGPYWEVGLLAGVLYNSWMVNTKSLGDCILSHAVTNACLSAYVILTGQWQYWL